MKSAEWEWRGRGDANQSMIRASVLAIGLAVVAARAGGVEGPLDIGTGPVLFVDSYFVGSLSNATLAMQRPVPREVVFRFDAPWEGPECAYITVLKDRENFRMYYRGGGETTEEVTCMAESRDGVNWERPNLGLFEFKGSKSNNIVYRGTTKAYSESHNFAPFIDANPAAKPEDRYKALALTKYRDPSGERKRALGALASPDGIHWRKLQEGPIITSGGFDSQNLAFWDEPHGKYACYFREGRNGVRSVRRALSADFLHWSDPEWIEYGSAPAEQFYTSAITPYFRNGNLYLGFPMRFVPERKEVGADARKVDALSDGVMISSHDGLNFYREFMEAFIRPGLDARNWGNGHGNNTPSWGLVPTGPAEMSLYWAEHYGADYSSKVGKLERGSPPQLRRGTLRLDGLGSVDGRYRGGEMVTKAFVGRGGKLRLNYATSAAGSIRVEVQDEQGAPLPGLAAEECEEIYGDELARPVGWKSGGSLAPLQGRALKLRFILKDADIYSLQMAP